MSEIPKAYEPQSVEDKWYDFWLKQGCFTADPARVSDKRPAYSIVIPPPNVTGVLHMGHVLNNTIQDILSRKARMDGKEVLWLPGTDHAGIATESMVARQLSKEEKKSKRDIGREEFLKRVWTWKEKHGGIIISQLKKLGCSCDWTRERFTMDPDYVRNVQRVFVDLYKKGLIYRGKRMVNWCPATQTALSDEEVEMREQRSWIYEFQVEVDGSPNTYLKIATTRPETIPGDTAVAVNPKDPRYAHLIGKMAVRPLPRELPREEKLIPIIGDEYVDTSFGTGVLKVTPAHDKADFDIGLRHKLPYREVIGPNGKMTDLAGKDLAGVDRFEARQKAVAVLIEIIKEQGGFFGAQTEDIRKPYTNNVGFSQRADVQIEPRLSEQWFLKYPAVPQSKACVAEGRMKFHPERWAKVYDHWLTNIQDWCISRQLWWGHRVPVWTLPLHVEGDGVAQQLSEYFFEWAVAKDVFVKVQKGEPNHGDTICFLSCSERADAAAVKLNAFFQSGEFDPSLQDGFPTARAKSLAESIMSGPAAAQIEQDPDVLDTWFSSWLWPFATMGWPEQTETLKKFYPTTDLVTAPEIIFFWVARMIMAGYEYMGELPFRNVYFTGIVRDKQGRKMSKSLGNSPDPLDLIAKYGADAIRFGTMRSAPLGQDVLFDEKDVELGRNFCNKLWNACRFRQMQGSAGVSPASEGDSPEQFATEAEIDPALLTSDDKWILLRLDQAIREVSQTLADYKFSEATAALYRFFWSEYCDWYVEASKAAFFGEDAKLKTNKLAVIDFVLGHTLRMFHPFMPFITEELWHGMGFNKDLPETQGGQTIMFAPWPKPFDAEEKGYFGLDDAADKIAQAKYELVSLGRNLRRELKLDPAKKLKFILKPAGDLAAAEVEVLKLLLNAEAIEIVAKSWMPDKGTPSAGNLLGELFLPLAGLIDIAVEQIRLTKDLEKIRDEIAKVQAKLANPNFARKVPVKVLEEHQQRLDDWQAKEKQIVHSLQNLREL